MAGGFNVLLSPNVSKTVLKSMVLRVDREQIGESLRTKMNRVLSAAQPRVNEEWSAYYLSRIKETFEGQGVRDGEGETWKERKPYYFAGKLLPSRPALIRTGALANGFYVKESEGVIRLLNREPYWKYHESSKARSRKRRGGFKKKRGKVRKFLGLSEKQSGGGFLPRRKVGLVTARDRREYLNMVKRIISEVI